MQNTKFPFMTQCMFEKTSVFKKIGGFGEEIEFGEDSIYAKYVVKKGYKFGINPNLAVVHNHMTTGKKLGWKKNWYDFRNWIYIILKHPKHFNLTNPKNLSLLIIERLRNLSGVIKSILNLQG